MSSNKPAKGERIRILTGYFEGMEGAVVDELALMFTVEVPLTGANPVTVFLYYDPMKGDDWELIL